MHPRIHMYPQRSEARVDAHVDGFKISLANHAQDMGSPNGVHMLKVMNGDITEKGDVCVRRIQLGAISKTATLEKIEGSSTVVTQNSQAKIRAFCRLIHA